MADAEDRPGRRSRGSRSQCLRIASFTVRPRRAWRRPPGALRFGGSCVSHGTSGRCGGGMFGSSGGGRLDLSGGELDRVHALDVEHRRVRVVHAALAREAHEAAVDLLAHEVTRVALLDARDLRLHERHQHAVRARGQRAQLREERHQARVERHEARHRLRAGRRPGPSARSPARARAPGRTTAWPRRAPAPRSARPAAPRARRSAAWAARRSARPSAGMPTRSVSRSAGTAASSAASWLAIAPGRGVEVGHELLERRAGSRRARRSVFCWPLRSRCTSRSGSTPSSASFVSAP